jgi:hypothetical protein
VLKVLHKLQKRLTVISKSGVLAQHLVDFLMLFPWSLQAQLIQQIGLQDVAVTAARNFVETVTASNMLNWAPISLAAPLSGVMEVLLDAREHKTYFIMCAKLNSEATAPSVRRMRDKFYTAWRARYG